MNSIVSRVASGAVLNNVEQGSRGICVAQIAYDVAGPLQGTPGRAPSRNQERLRRGIGITTGAAAGRQSADCCEGQPVIEVEIVGELRGLPGERIVNVASHRLGDLPLWLCTHHSPLSATGYRYCAVEGAMTPIPWRSGQRSVVAARVTMDTVERRPLHRQRRRRRLSGSGEGRRQHTPVPPLSQARTTRRHTTARGGPARILRRPHGRSKRPGAGSGGRE